MFLASMVLRQAVGQPQPPEPAHQVAPVGLREVVTVLFAKQGSRPFVKKRSQIAKRLSLSYKTVANYTTQIKNKLEVKTIAEIARIAISYDIVKV